MDKQKKLLSVDSLPDGELNVDYLPGDLVDSQPEVTRTFLIRVRGTAPLIIHKFALKHIYRYPQGNK